jgi:Domain of unknown function (DUF4432)
MSLGALRLPLYRQTWGEATRPVLEAEGLSARAWTYPSGVMALSLENARGRLVVLPWQGQMIWAAEFDGHDLTMRNLFEQPRPSATIAGTYGCFMFHAGLLRNGCPAPVDDHALHGEMPCAPMDHAWLEVGEDKQGAYLRLTGNYEYVQGFGDRYRATPSVTLRPDSGLFEIGMQVLNRAGKAMDLMYMAHMNYAYVPGGRFSQPHGYRKQRMRTSVPAHVRPTAEWTAYMAALAQEPSRLQVLDTAQLYDPEIVSFFDGVGTDERGDAHFFLDHPDGTAFYTRYSPKEFSHAARWVLYDADQQVAAFILPATCEPEGYQAERAKGNVRSLAPGEQASFSLVTGYLSPAERRALLP